MIITSKTINSIVKVLDKANSGLQHTDIEDIYCVIENLEALNDTVNDPECAEDYTWKDTMSFIKKTQKEIERAKKDIAREIKSTEDTLGKMQRLSAMLSDLSFNALELEDAYKANAEKMKALQANNEASEKAMRFSDLADLLELERDAESDPVVRKALDDIMVKYSKKSVDVLPKRGYAGQGKSKHAGRGGMKMSKKKGSGAGR